MSYTEFQISKSFFTDLHENEYFSILNWQISVVTKG